MKYASLSTTANNIGEEVQIISAQQFLPKVDLYLNKERLNTYNVEEKHKLIINGWFMRNYNRFYMSNNIKPLLISLHITPTISKKFFKEKKNLKFLLENAPVGCRDYHTLGLLEKHNIPAYYSGCLTLTLKKNDKIEKKDYVLLYDVSPKVEEHVKKITSRTVINISPMLNFWNTFEERMKIATLVLKKIQQAHVVITTRLHGALPAIALETPVIFIEKTGWNTQKERCSVYKDFFPYLPEEAFLSEFSNLESVKCSYKHLEIRNALIKKCETFTGGGHASMIPATSDDEDIELLFKMLSANSIINKKKALWDVPTDFLFEHLYQRFVKRINDDDLY